MGMYYGRRSKVQDNARISRYMSSTFFKILVFISYKKLDSFEVTKIYNSKYPHFSQIDKNIKIAIYFVILPDD